MQNSRSQFSRINQFLFFFHKKLRLSNPWNFKAPFLVTVPYLVLLLAGDYVPNTLQLMLAAVTVIVGVAGIGYLTNDLGDREKDRRIGKENATEGLALPAILALFLLFITLLLAPWFVLPFSKLSCALLGLELFLFFAYAFPPFRLKERGILGILADSFYAHLIPALLAAHTFQLAAQSNQRTYVYLLVFLCSWQLVLGIRNILFHQLKDLEQDKHSGTVTFVGAFGSIKTEKYLTTLILPLELLLFIGLISYITYAGIYVLPILACLLYWLINFVSRRHEMKEMGYRKLVYIFFDDLYCLWLPLFVLIALCLKSIYFLPVLAFHFLLFRNGAKNKLISVFNRYFSKYNA